MKTELEQARILERLTGEEDREVAQPEPRAPVQLVLGEIPSLLLIAAVGALVALLDAPVILRTLLGIPLILFIPGYTLVSALFPSREGLDGIERFALGFGLSLALIPLIALGIEYTPWQLTLGPILAGLLAASVIFSAIAVLRRARLPAAHRYVSSRPQLAIPHPGTWDRRTRFAAGIIVIGLLLLSGAGSIIVADRLQGDPMTEFALYNADGKPEFYPRELTSGQPATVMVEVTNREGKPEQYRLRITSGDDEIGRLDGIHVEADASWRQPVQFTVPTVGDQIPVLFELYRNDQQVGTTPYRTTRLFVTSGTPMPVAPPAPPTPVFHATHRVDASLPVNLRAGPSADTPTQGLVEPGTLLEATGETSESGGPIWRHFTLEDGRTGWIRDIDALPLNFNR
ncbi:MAG TPA: DUF1616 domain-containing protein [Nitrolancea sp.]|nr:DUF1616 domain-containing protein [Nitrolancea sp.]